MRAKQKINKKKKKKNTNNKEVTNINNFSHSLAK